VSRGTSRAPTPARASDPAVPPAGTADAARLTPAVAEVVERAGFVLDDLDVRPAGRRRVVRVVVDTAEVPGPADGPAAGADLDAVAALSRELSGVLDAADESTGTRALAPEGEYTLEVTTPGTDRPLTTPHHWRRAWLRRVAVTLTDGASLTGRVGAVTDTDAGDAAAVVTLAETGRRGTTLRELPLDTVARAGVEVEFKPPSEAEVEALRTAAGGPPSLEDTEPQDTEPQDTDQEETS
jgi:ribosome maturation factor RimP